MKTSRPLLRFLLAILAAVPFAPAHAVICQNAIPPVNPDSAYTDYGDGTVIHKPTGLMWKRCSEGQTWSGATCTGTASTHTWQAALDLAEAHDFAGRGGWRLPNINELRSLVEECRAYPAINNTIFPAPPNDDFWSGSPYAGVSYGAWGVNFSYGVPYFDFRSGTHHVRLVRGGQSFSPFDARGDATPDALGNFTAVTNATVGAVTTSTDSKTVSGIDTMTGVAIAGEGSPEYRVNDGAWTSAPGAVANGALLEVRLTAGAAASTRVATLTVGGVAAQFSVTAATGGSDTTPDPLGNYAPVTNAIAGALAASADNKTVTGITAPTGIGIAGEGSPEYRVNGGAWTSAPGTVTNGALLEVRLTAGAAASTRVATLTVGGVAAQFSVTAAGGGGGGGGDAPESTLPFPVAPVSYACTGPDVNTFASTEAATARPLSSALIMQRDLWLNVSLAPFAQPVDVYIVAELPGGVLLVLNSAGQWLPYPAQATPWRANSSAALNTTAWQAPLAAIPPGTYAAYLAAVPPGTNPATFSLARSHYHLWCTARGM
ncbi:MAG: DUF1566 domain-containing protein [Rhodocyclales bacterium]|nr:DUF1566 domain-containing protein [Rhodocyclales bacterium]